MLLRPAGALPVLLPTGAPPMLLTAVLTMALIVLADSMEAVLASRS